MNLNDFLVKNNFIEYNNSPINIKFENPDNFLKINGLLE